jgi:hypothetical protein
MIPLCALFCYSAVLASLLPAFVLWCLLFGQGAI